MAKQAVKGAYNVYRMALPNGANSEQRRDFERKIEAIRRVNPDWAVVSDWVKSGEKEAYVVVRKDKDYAYRRALYLAKSHLARAIVGGYGDKS